MITKIDNMNSDNKTDNMESDNKNRLIDIR